MPSSAPSFGGRHENGQNFLTDARVIRAFCDVVARTSGPIVEIGAGDGALSLPLSCLARSDRADGGPLHIRPVIALELDPKLARRLTARAPANLTVEHADALTYRYPRSPHVIAGNLPFHLTTAILRRLLNLSHWTDAVLIAQWEVARRRAGVGGATMLTASWWPWFDFTLHQRISRDAFRPIPSVDGGMFSIHRRPHPWVEHRPGYQALVHAVFTARGRGLGEILPRTTRFSRAQAHAWLRQTGLHPGSLPKDLNALQWAALWKQLR